MTTRRDVLRGIGSGVAVTTVAGTGVAAPDGGEEAGLRVAHASPDAPAVDVLVDGSAVIEGLAFREVTDYLEVPAGEYDVAVAVTGTDTTVFEADGLELASEDYTAVARGEVSADADTSFTVSVFEDTNGANIGYDQARVRALHASPDAPAVDVTVDDGSLTLFEDVSYGESSGYVVVPAGEYEVEIRPAGGGDPVFEADVVFEGRSTYTAFAEGYLTPDDEPAEEPFGLVPTQDKGAPPRGDPDRNGAPRGGPGR